MTYRWFVWLVLAVGAGTVTPLTAPPAKVAQVRKQAAVHDVEYEGSLVGGKSESWWRNEFATLLNDSVREEEENSPEQSNEHPHIKGTVNLIKANGYPAEQHTVRTEDDYLLTVFRVAQPGRPVAFLMHGLLTSSADYVLRGRGNALALLLYDAGFDVWMANARGTTPSRSHVRLSPSQSEFWDFSWHEIGERDLPACIDYVLANTNQSAVHYVGHSQGTTTFFVLGSERPEYMKKIKTFTALAPVAFLRDTRSEPVRLMALTRRPLELLLRLVGVNEFIPNSLFLSKLGDMFCDKGDVTLPVCHEVLFLICGTDTQQVDGFVVPEVLVNTPAGSSTKQLVHFGQLIAQRHLVFKKFDHGWLGNLARYQRISPPEYDLSRVTAPTYLFHSDNDLLAVQSNVDELVRRLPNIAADGLRRVPLGAFNHLDYLYARDVKALVYDDVIAVLQKHEAETIQTPAAH